MTEIRTTRLVLRPVVMSDAERIVHLAGDADVARMTGRLPHPYTLQDATYWIGYLGRTTQETAFAITRAGELIGACGCSFNDDRSCAEIGYWLGKPFWGQGIATEAIRALVRHCFEVLGLKRLTVSHMADNPASANVISKLGFVKVGPSKCQSRARDGEVDAVSYTLERSEAEAQKWFKAA